MVFKEMVGHVDYPILTSNGSFKFVNRLPKRIRVPDLKNINNFFLNTSLQKRKTTTTVLTFRQQTVRYPRKTN